MQKGQTLPESRKKQTLREKLVTSQNIIKQLRHELEEKDNLIKQLSKGGFYDG